MKFLTLSTVINGGEVSTQVQESTAQATTASPVGIFGSSIGMIAYIAFLILIFYFIGIRPQKKREKKLNELQASLNIGDWVVLDSGFYGKITSISEQVIMIELGTNKSVIVPVVKQRIVSKADPNLING